MSSTWPQKVPKIVDGKTPISEEGLNPIFGSIEERTEFLKGALEALNSSKGGRVTRVSVPVEESVQTGDAVNWNPESGVLVKAIWDPTSANNAGAIGIITKKHTSTLADVTLLSWWVSLNELSGVSSIVDLMDSDSFEPGIIYLSSRVAGKMTLDSREGGMELGHARWDGITFRPQSPGPRHSHSLSSLFNFPSGGTPASTTGAGENISFEKPVFVDYASASFSDSGLQLSVEVLPGYSTEDPFFLRIHRTSGGDWIVSRVSDPSGPASGSVTLSGPIGYHELVDLSEFSSLGNPGISFAFVRVDNEATTGDPVEDDFPTDETSMFIPVDSTIRGWTNANPANIFTPQGALLRYLSETQADVASSLSTGRSVLSLKGGIEAPGQEFIIVGAQLFWMDKNSEPWSSTESIEYWWGQPLYRGEERIQVLGTTPGDDGPDRVKDLISLSQAIEIVSQDSPLAARKGRLAIRFSPGKGISGAPQDGGTALDVGPSGDLIRRKNVSSIAAGPGVSISELTEGADPGTGRLLVSLDQSSLRGEVSSFSLYSAKESRNNGLSFIEFPNPNGPSGESSVVASVRVPSDIPMDVLSGHGGDKKVVMTLSARWFGSISGSGNIPLIVSSKVIREGVNISQVPATPISSAGPVSFPSGYQAWVVGSNSDSTTWTVDGGLVPDDIILFTVTRGPASDSYGGSLGLFSFRWNASLVKL